jgi:hypothetical protein
MNKRGIKFRRKSPGQPGINAAETENAAGHVRDNDMPEADRFIGARRGIRGE